MRRHGFVSIAWSDASAGSWDGAAAAVLQSGGSRSGDRLDRSSLSCGAVVGGLNGFSGVRGRRDLASAGSRCDDTSAGSGDWFGSRRHGFVSIAWSDASAGSWDGTAAAVLQSGSSRGGGRSDRSPLGCGAVVGGLDGFSSVRGRRD